MREVFLITGRGIGQVMFQNNALSGLLMLAGIACNSLVLSLLALAGCWIGTLTAFWLGYSREDILDGLYGFNGTLVGIAIGVFMEISIPALVLLVLGSALSTWVARGFRLQNLLPGFTAPFTLVVWLLLAFVRGFYPEWLSTSAAAGVDMEADFIRAFSLNVGQVMFQDYWISGLFFLLAIFLNSRLAGAYTVLGAVVPLLMFFWVDDYSSFNMGLFGYNGVLCAIALGDRSGKGLAWSVCSVLISVGLQIAGMQMGLTTLTAPFVLAIWIVLLLRRYGDK